MKKEFFARASKSSYLIGAVLCLIHLIISWSVIIDLGRSEPDAQWELIWIFFMLFDFPVSMLDFVIGIFLPNWSLTSLPYPVSEFRSFIIPSLVHGIIGPIWYFLLPIGISSLWRKHKLTKSKR